MMKFCDLGKSFKAVLRYLVSPFKRFSLNRKTFSVKFLCILKSAFRRDEKFRFNITFLIVLGQFLQKVKCHLHDVILFTSIDVRPQQI